MALEWKNATSYSRGDKKQEVRTVEARMGTGARLVVTRIRGLDDTWFMSLYGVDVSQLQLRAKDLEGAKAEAVDVLKDLLKQLDTGG